MGNSCSEFAVVNRQNDCNETIIHGEDRGFCSIAGPAGNDFRDSYCTSIGNFEWRTDEQENTCHYNSCNNGQAIHSSTECCKGCCPIIGASTRCARNEYRGDPDICCFRDYSCNSYNQNTCFDQRDSDSRSCSSEHRNLSSETCRDIAMNYCTNADGNHENWLSYWLTKEPVIKKAGTDQTTINYTSSMPLCQRVLYRNLYGNNSLGCSENKNLYENSAASSLIDSEGYVWSRLLIQRAYERYVKEGGSIINKESKQQDTRLNEFLWSICSKLPGLCQNFTRVACSKVIADDLIRNPELQKWCGCYMPNEQYKKYTDLYEINKECTPYCNSKDSLPLIDSNGITPLKCAQSTCVIDNVSIDLYQSKVGKGGINFAQICGSCDGGICHCTMTGINLIAVEATIPEINIYQKCSGTRVCYEEITKDDGNVNTIRTSCDDTESTTKTDNSSKSFYYSSFFIIGVLIVLFIVWWIMFPDWLPETLMLFNKK